MALRRALTKSLFIKLRDPSPLVTLEYSPFRQTLVPPNAAKSNFHREFHASPDSVETGFFRRFLQRRGINQGARIPEFLFLPVGDKLKERLRLMNAGADRLSLEGLRPPPATETAPAVEEISVRDARKILRVSQLEKLRRRLRQIPTNSISHSEFVEICVDACSSREQGLEFARMLDESGNVIVLGKVVFLRPEQVARSMETVIREWIAIPSDPRRKELEGMERQKAAIDRKAESLVRGELYCGLGFVVAQTVGFMRLTFWELSWDVMEPICFFVTSLHFALAYAFFLRTSREPSFEGYFQRRFRAKQKKLMSVHNFDLAKYNQLRQAFYPPDHLDHPRGAVFGAI